MPLKINQAQYPKNDQIDGDDVIQQSGDDEDQYSCNNRQDWMEITEYKHKQPPFSFPWDFSFFVIRSKKRLETEWAYFQPSSLNLFIS
jgi:hypothetical protein